MPVFLLQGRSLAEAFDQHSLQRSTAQQDAAAQPTECTIRSVRKVSLNSARSLTQVLDEVLQAVHAPFTADNLMQSFNKCATTAQ